MAILTILEKINGSGEPIKYGQKLVVDSEKLIGVKTGSLYVRKNTFLSQRGNGDTGAGDICRIDKDNEIEVNSNLFDRINAYALKANAVN